MLMSRGSSTLISAASAAQAGYYIAMGAQPGSTARMPSTACGGSHDLPPARWDAAGRLALRHSLHWHGVGTVAATSRHSVEE